MPLSYTRVYYLDLHAEVNIDQVFVVLMPNIVCSAEIIDSAHIHDV